MPCQHDQCKKRANYGFEGDKPKFCAAHRLERMVDFHNKRCQQNECTKQASFAIKGNKAQYCGTHRLDGMIGVTTKLCKHNECNRQACYGFKGNSVELCSSHIVDGMINLKNRCCQYNGCNTQSSFAFHGNKSLYCAAHRLDGMINVNSTRCKTEGCDTTAQKERNKGYCLHCYMNVFPNEKITRNYKVKENEVLNFIIEKFSSCTVVRDRRIQDGCSARRPDVHIDLGYQVIIVEVDENQHETYDCSCENKRIMQLSQDVGHRKIVFIRFNPDAYIENGVKINSCFSRTKQGFLIIPKSKQAEWENRLNVLHDTIKYWMKYKTNKTVEIVHLFYDVL